MSGIVNKLRYMGRQYAAGQISRGGAGGKHYLEEAADHIEELERHNADILLALKDVVAIADRETDPFIRARAIIANAAEAIAPRVKESQVDWLGLALDLEQQAKRVESQTLERAMLAAANGLRIMGSDTSQ